MANALLRERCGSMQRDIDQLRRVEAEFESFRRRVGAVAALQKWHDLYEKSVASSRRLPRSLSGDCHARAYGIRASLAWSQMARRLQRAARTRTHAVTVRDRAACLGSWRTFVEKILIVFDFEHVKMARSVWDGKQRYRNLKRDYNLLRCRMYALDGSDAHPSAGARVA